MIEIRIPKLGLTMENAVLTAWQAADGASVHKGDILLIIETDKLTFEVPAPAGGILVQVAAEEAVCAVDEVVAYLAKTLEECDQLRRQHTSREPVASLKTAAAASSKNRPATGQMPVKGRVKASPLARAMAAERGLDFRTIAGSGPGGRIVKADILGAAQHPTPLSGLLPHADSRPIFRRIPISGPRRHIFERMRQSLSESAQFSLHTEASATALLKLRRNHNSNGRQISYNAMLIKIAAAALKEHRGVNASVRGSEILIWEHINIGLAMHIDGTLVVPVFRSPDTRNLGQINTRINSCIRRIKQNRLMPDDLSDGTFTITNLGFADIDHFTPIVRPPESAVLGVGRIMEKAVVSQGRIVPEARIGLSLTVDHRIIDGAPAAHFLDAIKQMVEDPKLLV